MAEISFYHLTRSTLAQALPQLLLRTLAARQRALVLTTGRDLIAPLSDALWAYPGWLPHGSSYDGDAALQPIWLDTEAAPLNGARYLFLTGGATAAPDGFDRVFDMFDGTDEAAVAAARDRWRTAKAAGHALSYWRQAESGWQKNG